MGDAHQVEKPHQRSGERKQTLTAGHAEAQHLIVKPVLSCFEVAAGKVEEKEKHLAHAAFSQ